MTTCLSRVLPGLTPADLGQIRGAFDCLFNYYSYKGFLDHVGQQRAESMKMLIFNAAQQYVAHVYLNFTSRKTGPLQFTVWLLPSLANAIRISSYRTQILQLFFRRYKTCMCDRVSREDFMKLMRSRWMKTENFLNYCLVVSFLYVFYFCCAVSTVLFIQCTQARIRTINLLSF